MGTIAIEPHSSPATADGRAATLQATLTELPAQPGLNGYAPADQPALFRVPGPLRAKYQVVIVGAGGHGLATAYYLASRHQMADVCVLDAGALGRGNTGRNTAIIRSNYLTPQGVRFYHASMQLWDRLADELDLNLFYSPRGHFTLAHSDSAIRTMRWRAEVNQHLGVDSQLVGPEFIRERVPELDLSCGCSHQPVLGALYHPPGAIAGHDAVAWAYAKGASQLGVEVHQHTPVTDIDVRDGHVRGVQTPRGYIACDAVLSAVAGSTPTITGMLGLRTPITVHPLQAAVSEPMHPWLDAIVVSASLHCYVSQDVRGDLIMGASLDPYELHSQRSTLDFLESLAGHLLQLFPCLGEVCVNRQWAGLSDMTPDFSPIMGTTPIGGFYLDSGWGTWGFKATPICGYTMASTIATKCDHGLIQPFNLSRFGRYELIGEKAAASVGH